MHSYFGRPTSRPTQCMIILFESYNFSRFIRICKTIELACKSTESIDSIDRFVYFNSYDRSKIFTSIICRYRRFFFLKTSSLDRQKLTLLLFIFLHYRRSRPTELKKFQLSLIRCSKSRPISRSTSRPLQT